MNRDQLERQVWRQLRTISADRHDAAPAAVARILAAADTYAYTREDLRAAARLAAQERDTPERQAERRAALVQDRAYRKAAS